MAQQLGEYLKQRFEEMKENRMPIGDVRGNGSFICVELVKTGKRRKPASLETSKICYRA